ITFLNTFLDEMKDLLKCTIRTRTIIHHHYPQIAPEIPPLFPETQPILDYVYLFQSNYFSSRPPSAYWDSCSLSLLFHNNQPHLKVCLSLFPFFQLLNLVSLLYYFS